MIDLQIHQQFGKIGLEISPAQYRLENKNSEITMRQEPAQISLQRTDPDIQVDSSPVREFLGYGGIEFMMRRFSAEVQQKYLEDLEKNVKLGEAFAAIQKKISIPEILCRFSEPAEKRIGIAALPPIEISVQPAALEYRAQTGGVSTEFDWGKVSIQDFTFPKVKSYLEQEPSLEIKAVGQVYDRLA